MDGLCAKASLATPTVEAQARAGKECFTRIKLMMLTVGLDVGGTEGQVLEIASRLDRQHFEVFVCTLKQEGTIAQEIRDLGIRVFALNGEGVWDARVLYRLFHVVRREHPDVVHAFLSASNVAACLIRIFIRIPVLILSIRDVEVWKGWHHRLVDRLTVQAAHAVTCCSEAVRQFLLWRIGGGPQKYIVIHNGVSTARFCSLPTLYRSDMGLQGRTPVVGTICRLVEPKKGLTVLLKAIAELSRPTGSPPCQLLIVGEGPALEQLQKFSFECRLQDWVLFSGMRRDIDRMLAIMDIFVLPSLYEGFGISIIEAMAAGKAVIATAVGGIPEIIVDGQTGVLVPPNDPVALAVAIKDLLDHPTKAHFLGIQGQKRALENFSIESKVKQHEGLYWSLLNRTPRRGFGIDLKSHVDETSQSMAGRRL